MPKPPKKALKTPTDTTGSKAAGKQGLHARNRHRERYDFSQLIRSCPELASFVAINDHADQSIDFADPKAVKTLNRALLRHFYGISTWDIPPGYLCPPIPGRADYLHYLADLLAASNGGEIPRGNAVRALDIGTGANCIYPILGHREYGWHFLGSDIDTTALACAGAIVDANSGLADGIQLRLQRSPEKIFLGLLEDQEQFDVCLCNPPFHASPQEAREGSQRKWQQLGKNTGTCTPPVLNFGGQGRELWCEGGEAAFIGRMVKESTTIPTRCLWFTTLVSKSANLPSVRSALKQARVSDFRVIEMAQGQKKSRIVAWTFLNPEQRQAWRTERWQTSALQ
ncbi:MAG: 23S rRNA (adenine(1618)-N(6))-methyltransferase RlmF [Holophaga sp.]